MFGLTYVGLSKVRRTNDVQLKDFNPAFLAPLPKSLKELKLECAPLVDSLECCRLAPPVDNEIADGAGLDCILVGFAL